MVNGSFREAPVLAFQLLRVFYYLRGLHQCIRDLLLNRVYLIHFLGYPFLCDVIRSGIVLISIFLIVSRDRFGLTRGETFLLGIGLILFDQYIVPGVMGHSLLFNILEFDDFWLIQLVRFSPFLALCVLESLF